MGAGVDEEGESSVPRRRWPRVLAVLALLLGLVLAGLWLARKPIARDEADRWLSDAHVPARYTISNLGFGRQRLTGVVIGDPAHPDLVADWLEARTGWGLHGPYLASVSGGHVRVRARWADGRLSLGNIDRLLPGGPAGKPFALPALALDVEDLRARVETPWGVIGAKLSGRGRLDGGFDGRLAVTTPRLRAGGCDVAAVSGAGRVRIVQATVSFTGPLAADTVGCGQAAARGVRADLAATIDPRLPEWRAQARVAIARATAGGVTVNGLGGTIDVTRSPMKALPAGARGAVNLRSGRFAAAGIAGQAATLVGRFFYGPTDFLGRPAPMVFTSAMTNEQSPGMRLGLTGARLPAARLVAAARLAGAGQGTPAGPLFARLARAGLALGRGFDLDADVQPEFGQWEQGITVHRLALRGASGGRITFGSGRLRDELTYWRTQRFGERWEPGRGWLAHEHGAGGGVIVRGAASMGGGGLPDATVTFSQLAANYPVDAHIVVRPYSAGGASLALGATDLRWTPGPNTVRLKTQVEVSGPIGGGRVDRLAAPLDLRWEDGALKLGGGCAPVRWERVAVAGLRLDPGALRLCPTGGALVTMAGGTISGGVRIAATRLTGRLGATPLALAAEGAEFRLGDRAFGLRKLEAWLGPAERQTRLTAAALDGRAGSNGLAGRFAGAAGRIAAVPLVMSEAAGTWHFAGGALALTGGLTVSDAAAAPRFQPLAARDAALQLASGRITAEAMLHEPVTGTKVADVTIRHDVAAGRGKADLTVAGIAFGKALQPERLTRLTYGVVADVNGTVTGDGHIAWSPTGVTSTGLFRTGDMDLAAAFGPVTGLAGEVRFTDLLQLESAPGQRVTVKSINPGVPVTDGVVTLQTLPGTRVRVEGAHWPFAGGALTLAPTLLDFSGPAERRLTFTVAGAEADKFLQSFDFKNLNATGTFDGVLPMIFDASGGRIENGRLAVREGGGTLAYVGPVSQKELGFWGDFAFEALKSLRYRSLAVTMNGPLAGEMVTEVRFTGVRQGAGAKSNFIIHRLQQLPIAFNIRIRAPFRALLDTTASFYDPKRLNLPELIERQEKAVQPPASETVP